MVNQDILTSLKNSIDRGEPLQHAIKVLINSGYNPREVKEASNFIGHGAYKMQEQKPDEELTTPSKKSFLSKLKFWKNKPKSQKIPKTKRNKTFQEKVKNEINKSSTQKNTSEPESQKLQTHPPKSPTERTSQTSKQQTTPSQQPPATQQTTNSQTPSQQPPATQQTTNSQTPPQQPQPHPPQQKQGDIKKLNKPKKSHFKEIILLIILLILIGILIMTFIFRDTILGFFTG